MHLVLHLDKLVGTLFPRLTCYSTSSENLTVPRLRCVSSSLGIKYSSALSSPIVWSRCGLGAYQCNCWPRWRAWPTSRYWSSRSGCCPSRPSGRPDDQIQWRRRWGPQGQCIQMLSLSSPRYWISTSCSYDTRLHTHKSDLGWDYWHVIHVSPGHYHTCPPGSWLTTLTWTANAPYLDCTWM